MVDIVNLTNPRVFISKSGILNAGLGLFARRDFSPNEVLAPYRGKILTAKEVQKKYPGKFDGRYLVKIGRRYVDGREPLSASAARFANCVGPDDQANSQLIADPKTKRVFLVAATPILRGQEIVWDYGPAYPWVEGSRGTVGANVPTEPPPLDRDIARGLAEQARLLSGDPSAKLGHSRVEEKEAESLRGSSAFSAEEKESKEPENAPSFSKIRIGQFVVTAGGYEEDPIQVVEILERDSLGQFLTGHIYGSYDHSKSIHDRIFRRGWVDARGTVVYRAKRGATCDPYLFKVLPEDVISAPFARLVRSRIPEQVSVDL